jgi:hypothetical protein
MKKTFQLAAVKVASQTQRGHRVRLMFQRLPMVSAKAMSVFLAGVAQRHSDEFILMVLAREGP